MKSLGFCLSLDVVRLWISRQFDLDWLSAFLALSITYLFIPWLRSFSISWFLLHSASVTKNFWCFIVIARCRYLLHSSILVFLDCVLLLFLSYHYPSFRSFFLSLLLSLFFVCCFLSYVLVLGCVSWLRSLWIPHYFFNCNGKLAAPSERSSQQSAVIKALASLGKVCTCAANSQSKQVENK